jgi:hypothetical protein
MSALSLLMLLLKVEDFSNLHLRDYPISVSWCRLCSPGIGWLTAEDKYRQTNSAKAEKEG